MAWRTERSRTGATRAWRERRPDALDPGFHGVRTPWIRGFMAFRLARRIRTVMLMVSMCPESGSLGRRASLGRATREGNVAPAGAGGGQTRPQGPTDRVGVRR
jgi:hypothetical protein